MTRRKSSDSRFFLRCALMRFEEAMVLFDAGFTTGAVYLAGYAVECVLKALLLSTVPASQRPSVLASFRGNLGHDLVWLCERYYACGGTRFPKAAARSFTLISDWSTDLRYSPRKEFEEADAFLRAAEAVLFWAKVRL
jgi:HEPN domain-containing protein